MNDLVKPVTAIAIPSEWLGAADRGLEARKERERIISSVLKTGLDFGIIPGTTKPTLLKPGAEKISDSLNLYPSYEPIGVIENFDRPLFFYRYRCLLKQRGSDEVIETGIGSCNSMEAKYRWRNGERKCPSCGNAAIIKGKQEYGGGFVCFKKKGGCGAKFADDDPQITSQPVGKVPNDDIFTHVNSIDKIAQKRSLIAAALNLGFSEHFTQDLDDFAEEEPVKMHKAEVQPCMDDKPLDDKFAAPPPSTKSQHISRDEAMYLNELVGGDQGCGWDFIYRKFNVSKSTQLTKGQFDEIVRDYRSYAELARQETEIFDDAPGEFAETT